LNQSLQKRVKEGGFLLLLAISLFFMMSLVSYSAEDPSWGYVGPRSTALNWGGPAGAWFASVLFTLVGVIAYLFPLMIGWAGWLMFRDRNNAEPVHPMMGVARWGGFILTLIGATALAALHMHRGKGLPEGPGGIVGHEFSDVLVSALSSTGATLGMLAAFLIGFTLFSGISWLLVIDRLGAFSLKAFDQAMTLKDGLIEKRKATEMKQQRKEVRIKEQKRVEKRKQPVVIETPKPKAVEPSVRVEKERQMTLIDPVFTDGLPSLDLLDPPKPSGHKLSPEELRAMSGLVERKLADFNVEATVETVHPGPVVALYELNLAPGTKASKVTNLSTDLARALSVRSVRVVEVIPGRPTIGVEIPNEHREMVFLSEILRSEKYDSSKSPLTLSLGKDIAGEPVVADLAKMPHALIAGTTGSGKSVAINTMILSLLYKATPEDVRMIMVDPKMLELSVYEGIPHLLAPVVTDMKDAQNALRWCVAEMERRYRLMAALGVRNVTGYNKKIKDAIKAGQPITDPLYKGEPDIVTGEIPPPPELNTMPYIVVIIDELADMMMVVGKKVEELIARLAQKARAAGIHLLLATQRPSVDVITGLIKANVPTRIAFQVSSRIDSRTILDQMGAEHLLGHGDMLYMPPGTSIPLRAHGAFVDDHEVHAVVEYVKSLGEPRYIDEITNEPTEAIPGLSAEASGVDTEDADPLFDEAVQIVTESRRASISGVQRRLKIGYNRAARLVEEMERVGIVSEPDNRGNREVLAPPPIRD